VRKFFGLRNIFAFLVLINLIWFYETTDIWATEKIGRPVRIVSLCFHNESLDKIAQIIDDEGSKGVDLIVLPETWRGQDVPEILEGETFTELSRLAKKHKTYIISPIDRKEGNSRFNSATLIDRTGKIVFIYDKVYPYWCEYDLDPPVDPGEKDAMVYETDFGRLGLTICYDANFPEVWQRLRDDGAEIVVWPSAYSAGTQLQAYALLHHYYIVSSTYTRDCQVYDITGKRIIDQQSENITIARFTLDLDRNIYHENFNIEKRDMLLEKHKDEVKQELHMPREQWFVLKAKKPGVLASDLARQFGLETLRDYQDRSRKQIDQKRGFSFIRRFCDPSGEKTNEKSHD